MQSVIGALRVNLGLDSAAFTEGLQNARGSLAQAGASMRQVGQTLSLSVTAPLVGIAALTVKTAGDFEASMNRVKAALGATEGEFTALSAKARELGETTQFSASQAADAIEILAKNGVSAGDILGGALDASLTLAAASSADMGAAADVATDAMLNFGKQAGDLQSVVDNVTGVLLESKFGFDDYRLAIGQAGGVAGGFGVEFEEFNAVIASTSSAFASGSDAGTSFKTFLQRLTPSSKTAADAMSELGIEFFDAAGNMKSMADVAQELQDGVAGLNEEARNTALGDIFGQDAIRTAIALSREGAAGIREMTAAIGEASAADQAAARMAGLNGQLLAMKSAFQELQLVIADSGLLAVVTGIVTGVTSLTRALAEADPAFVQFGVVAGALAAAIGPIAVAIGLVVTALGAPVVGLIAVFIAVVAGAVAFKDEFIAVKDAIVAAFGTLPAQMEEIGGQVIAGLTTGIYGRLVDLNTAIDNTVQGMVDRIRGSLGIQSPSKVFRQIGVHIMEGLGLGISETGAQVEGLMEGITSDLSQSISGMFKSVLTGGKSFKDALGDLFSGLSSRFLGKTLDSLFSAIPSFFGGARALGGPVSPQKAYLVGEEGPELFSPGSAGTIIPNNKLPSGGGTNISVNVINEPGVRTDVTRERRSDGSEGIVIHNAVIAAMKSKAGRAAIASTVGMRQPGQR